MCCESLSVCLLLSSMSCCPRTSSLFHGGLLGFLDRQGSFLGEGGLLLARFTQLPLTCFTLLQQLRLRLLRSSMRFGGLRSLCSPRLSLSLLSLRDGRTLLLLSDRVLLLCFLNDRL